MPYKTNADLPEGVKNSLPFEAQNTWRTIYNSAAKLYVADARSPTSEEESRCAATAWAGLKNAGWQKNTEGHWIKSDVKKLDNDRHVFIDAIQAMRDDIRKLLTELPAQDEEKPESEPDKRLLKIDAKQRYTLGVVYEPDTVDSQGDFADEAEIEKACWSFNRKLQGKLSKSIVGLARDVVKAVGGGEARIDITDLLAEIEKSGLNDMHISSPLDDNLGEVVESYITRSDMVLDGQLVKNGSWLLGVVWHPDYFCKIESGERTGLSMEGRGRRIKVAE